MHVFKDSLKLTLRESGVWLAAAALFVQLFLNLNAAFRLSPTWDEIVYPAAGFAQWTTDAIEWNTEHGIGGKLLFGLPLLPLHPALPVADLSKPKENEYDFGFRFTFQNHIPARKIIFYSRLPAVLFSFLTALLLGFWAESLWGAGAAFLAIVTFSGIPILMSRGHLALLEGPMYFFSVAALYLHDRALSRNSARWRFLCGAALGLALICKMSALPLALALFLLQWTGRAEKVSLLSGLKSFCWIALGACFSVGILYSPWKGAWPALRQTVAAVHTWQPIPYFWHGVMLTDAPFWVTWGSLLIKAPLALCLLGLIGGTLWWKSQAHRSVWWHMLVFVGCTVGAELAFHKTVTTVQVSSLYLVLPLLAGACAGPWPVKEQAFKKIGVGLLVLWSFFATASVYPNMLAYFNESVGGSANGYRWLADSDQDWGQTLPLLQRYLQKRNPGGVILAYSGSADPWAWGIAYQDLISPALVTKFHSGTPLAPNASPILLAVAAKVIQSEPRFMGWLVTHRKPETLVAQTFFIYDITRDAEAWRWLAAVYADTHRLELSRLAILRAAANDPGNSQDRQLLAAIDKAEKRMIKSHP